MRSMNTLLKRAALGLPVAFLAASLFGCASPRDPINRVQPNYLTKAQLDGEWYYQRTVVDVPASNGFTFVGNTDHAGVSRISWDIQEDTLYARRTTELIKGADDKLLAGEKYKGEVIAAFKIESHFDITKEYNPTTGEQLNILSENTRDRPWYERTYVRVDWSQNLVTNYNLDFEATSIESVPYFVQDINQETGERNEDAPLIEEDGSYFDVTSRIFAKAGTVDFPGYGTIPLCYLRGQDFTECGSGEYAIRHSFKRIDPASQYEAQPYKGKETEVFGYFTTTRMVYDPQTGIREQGKERYLNRHNMWKKWRDAEGKLIPYADRELRPIVYFVNRRMPDDLKAIARKVADQYNDTFIEIVRQLGHEPKDRAFILCENNPVKEGDPAECGKVGNSPRLGDVRYSFMAYVPKYMQYGLLGLGPSNNDPETGEILSGVAYVYHHNNTAAYKTQEMVELLNGNRNPSTYVSGVDLTDWVADVNAGTAGKSRVHGLDKADHMVDRIANGWRSKFWDGARIKITEADEKAQQTQGFDKWVRPHFERIYEIGFSNGTRHSAQGRLAQLKGTYVEDLMMDKEILFASGLSPDQTPTEAQKDIASSVRGGFADLAGKRSELREAYAERHNMYLPEMADDALIGLARELKDTPSDQVYEIVRQTIYTAVLTHEVGHSLGLMHNFGGSDDSLNYHDQYWKIRDDGVVGPRINDPITEAEKNAKIYDYAYSSIMDYAGRYTIDGQGLGKYDKAALMYGYAQKVQVFNDIGGMTNQAMKEWFERDGEILLLYNTGPQAVHYTTFYNNMGAKLYEANNRQWVDIGNVSDDFSTADVNGQTLARVPYIYCSHSRYNLGDSCLTRDFGADSMERMTNILDELNTWYIQRSFPRGIVGWSNSSYVRSYYGRIYNRLKKWNDLYGLYNDLLPTFYTPEQVKTFLTDPVGGWGDKTWAVQNAFNYLVQTILTPDVGDYGGPIAQPDGSSRLEKNYGSTNLDVTNGRYYSTSWHDGDRECGYTWWECLHHVGHYLDKVMAIHALSDSRTNFVGRSTPEDIREWEVGYYNTFPEQIARLNAAMMSQDFSQVGPYWENGELKHPNYAGGLEESHSGTVNPYATFSIQLYWQVLGQARFFSNFDQSFVDDSAVFVLGSGTAPDVEVSKLYLFDDPTTGIVYAAYKFDGRVGAGHDILKRANLIKARSGYCDTHSKSDTSDDDCVSSTFSKERASAELLNELQMIKVMADLNPLMRFGNPYSP